MRRPTNFGLIGIALVLAACATSPRGKELQAAQALRTVNELTTTAVDLDVVGPDEAEAVLAVTRTARKYLQRSIAARRAGEPREVWEALLDSALDALAEAQALLAKENQ